MKLEIKTFSSPGPASLLCQYVIKRLSGRDYTGKTVVVDWMLIRAARMGNGNRSQMMEPWEELERREGDGRWEAWSLLGAPWPRGRADRGWGEEWWGQSRDTVFLCLVSWSLGPLLAASHLRVLQEAVCSPISHCSSIAPASYHRQEAPSLQPSCFQEPELGQRSNRFWRWINDAWKCLIPHQFLGLFFFLTFFITASIIGQSLGFQESFLN